MSGKKLFKNAHQLRQLRRLDPASYRAALTAARGGFLTLASEITRKGMLGAFERLVAGRQQAQPDPVPAGHTVCDAYHASADPARPRLVRCRRRARYRLTLRAGEVVTVNRCRQCRDELHEQVAKGSTFEILDEELIVNNQQSIIN